MVFTLLQSKKRCVYLQSSQEERLRTLLAGNLKIEDFSDIDDLNELLKRLECLEN
jgi:hypothetical protein